jgi:hypothetical protein
MPQKTFLTFWFFPTLSPCFIPLSSFLSPLYKRTLYITPLRVYICISWVQGDPCATWWLCLYWCTVYSIRYLKIKVKCVHNNNINPYTRIS